MAIPKDINLSEYLIIGQEKHPNAFIFELKKNLKPGDGTVYKYLIAFYKNLKATKKELIDTVLKATKYDDIRNRVEVNPTHVGEDSTGNTKPKSIHRGNDFKGDDYERLRAKVAAAVRDARDWRAPRVRGSSGVTGHWIVPKNRLRRWRDKIYVSDAAVKAKNTVKLCSGYGPTFTCRPLEPTMDWLNEVIGQLLTLTSAVCPETHDETQAEELTASQAGTLIRADALDCGAVLREGVNESTAAIAAAGTRVMEMCELADGGGAYRAVSHYECLVRDAIGRSDNVQLSYIKNLLDIAMDAGRGQDRWKSAMVKKICSRLLRWGQLVVRHFLGDDVVDAVLRWSNDERHAEIGAHDWLGLGHRLRACGAAMGAFPAVTGEELKSLGSYGQSVRRWWVKIYDFLGSDRWSAKCIVALDKFFVRVCESLQYCVDVDLTAIENIDGFSYMNWVGFAERLRDAALESAWEQLPQSQKEVYQGDVRGAKEAYYATLLGHYGLRWDASFDAVAADPCNWDCAYNAFDWMASLLGHGEAALKVFKGKCAGLVSCSKLCYNSQFLSAHNYRTERDKVRKVLNDCGKEGRWFRKFLEGLSEADGRGFDANEMLSHILGFMEGLHEQYTTASRQKTISGAKLGRLALAGKLSEEQKKLFAQDYAAHEYVADAMNAAAAEGYEVKYNPLTSLNDESKVSMSTDADDLEVGET